MVEVALERPLVVEVEVWMQRRIWFVGAEVAVARSVAAFAVVIVVAAAGAAVVVDYKKSSQYCKQLTEAICVLSVDDAALAMAVVR